MKNECKNNLLFCFYIFKILFPLHQITMICW